MEKSCPFFDSNFLLESIDNLLCRGVNIFLSSLFAFIVLFGLSNAAPTQSRTWTSTAGTSLEASAQEFADGSIVFQRGDGTTLKVPLDKLIEDDQVILIDHFAIPVPKPGEPFGSSLPQASGLPYALGEVHGPIDADGEAKYFLYLPTTLKEGRKAPVIFWSNFSPANAALTRRMIIGAELTGTIAAASADSKNGNNLPVNHAFAKASLKHIAATLPTDEDRTVFTGVSGGAAMAFHNAARLPHAGVITSVGYIPDDAPKGGYYFITGGASDYNRYGSALAADGFGEKKSTLRYTTGGHHTPIPDLLIADGLLWVSLHFYADNEKDYREEMKDLEVGVLKWVEELRKEQPHRAYHAARLTSDLIPLSDHNKPLFEEVLAELGTPENKQYVEGLAALEEFGRKEFAPIGSGSKSEHTTPAIQKGAAELEEKYKGVPEIEEFAREMGKVTTKIPGR